MQLEILLFPLILSAAHVLGQKWDVKGLRTLEFLRSFSAGISTAYVFIFLIPEVFLRQQQLGIRGLFLLTLAGFTSFHLVVKFIQQYSSFDKSPKLSERVHVLMTAVYNVVIGFVLLDLLVVDRAQAVILFVVLIVHNILGDIVGEELREDKQHETNLWKLLIIVSPTVGAWLWLATPVSAYATAVMLALAVGGIMYVSIREEIPPTKSGRPFFYLLGVLSVVLILLLTL